ncbi:Lactose permease [Colletotrichum sidae]|uniref:Lactose permease n=1 Tax=Colletotrichum sidae TaxID=1347389 RepID=A0A4R8T387_9PEZI|nr:Lactose permease [Colletotrichum sidae]
MSSPESAGIPVTVDAAIASRRGALKWMSNPGIVKLNCILALSLVSSYATGYDGSMMNGLQSLDTWNASFNNPGASELGLLNAIQNVGQLVALPFCAWFCDRFGRKPALLGSAAVLLVGVALQGAAQNVGMFTAARGVLGFGLALNITAAPLLITELAYPSQRAPLVSVYNSLWGLGALSAAWVTFGTFRIGSTWAWRVPSVLQGVSSFVQLGLCFCVEESPRWLVSRERDAEAEALLVKYHANGDASDVVVPLEMEEIRAALRLEAEASRTTSYMSFFQTPGNRRRFFIILAVGFFSQWSGNGLISYYLTLILNSIGYTEQDTQTLINALLTLWGMVWGLLASLLVNRFRRRTMFLASTVGALVCYVVWTALQATYEQQTDLSGSGSPALARAILAVVFLYNVAFTMGWGALQVTYVVEILPFNLRAKGLVLYNLFVALALVFNQYANPVGVTSSKWRYYITYDVWLAFEALVVYFLFVETGKMSLEETAVILDGNEVRLTEEVARKTEKLAVEAHEADFKSDTKA